MRCIKEEVIVMNLSLCPSSHLDPALTLTSPHAPCSLQPHAEPPLFLLSHEIRNDSQKADIQRAGQQ